MIALSEGKRNERALSGFESRPGAALTVGALSVSAPSQAVSGCPRPILCTDNWVPVICSNGVVYSNGCYAYRACATGCVPYGNGGAVLE
jgi:hypothetical protein